MKKIFSNKEIYEIASLLIKNFSEDNLILPIKVNYAIQLNLKNLKDRAELIDKARISVGKKYGVLQDDGNYLIKEKEKRERAQEELNKLFEVEDTINIYMIDLNELENCNLTASQMQTLLFMIKEE